MVCHIDDTHINWYIFIFNSIYKRCVGFNDLKNAWDENDEEDEPR